MREKIVRTVAGAFVLISITLAYYFNLNWLWFTAFVGINLIQSSFTGFCPLEKVLDKLNIDKGGKCC
jgi:hypothetical protein